MQEIILEVVPTFQLYLSGVFYDPSCVVETASGLNHAVVIVGYGTDQVI
jgi:Papain family cysteine protease